MKENSALRKALLRSRALQIELNSRYYEKLIITLALGRLSQLRVLGRGHNEKTTKGALAAAAAGFLLLGGAGTIAYWSDSSTISGGTVNTGNLALSDAACSENWLYAPGNSGAGDPVSLLVPGDAITKECTFTVSATGDNLTATLNTPDSALITAEGTDTFEASVAATYNLAGSPVTEDTPITDANDGQTLTATVTVTFPFGDEAAVNANDTQNVTASLNDIAVTLVQTES